MDNVPAETKTGLKKWNISYSPKIIPTMAPIRAIPEQSPTKEVLQIHMNLIVVRLITYNN